MTLALDGRPFEARVLPVQKQARIARARLCWAVAVMLLLNALVWGGMIATARGVIDVHRLVDEAQAVAATWIAALPQVSITITSR
ncbi:MAG: hypothetical protein J7515_13980 [Caulobacter sp.]|nr:hypothetical protein [Caulobacter sp.]